MTFIWPTAFWLMLVLPILAFFYLRNARRRGQLLAVAEMRNGGPPWAARRSNSRQPMALRAPAERFATRPKPCSKKRRNLSPPTSPTAYSRTAP